MPESAALPRVTVALALALALAGCSSNDKKPQTLPTMASPSVSRSPTPSPSMSPGATAESVKAFIKSYYDEINRAIETGNANVLRTMSVPACSCRQLADFIEHGNGGPNVTGGRFAVVSVRPHDVTSQLAKAEVTYDVGAAEIRNASGGLVKRLPAFKAARDDLSLVRENDKWIIAEVVELTQ